MKNARPQTTEASALDKCHSNATGDLFPELLPTVAPAIWPTAGTQADNTLRSLLRAPALTQADYRHSWRLAAYVNCLRNAGWAIGSRLVSAPNGNAHISEYTLDRAEPRTAAALATRQAGKIDPPLLDLLALGIIAAGVAVVLA